MGDDSNRRMVWRSGKKFSADITGDSVELLVRRSCSAETVCLKWYMVESS